MDLDRLLLLIPTAFEATHLLGALGLTMSQEVCPQDGVTTALCGFGPIAAAARTAILIERLQPSRVMLVGIAGSLDPDRAPVGGALRFGWVAVDGVGVGGSDDFVSGERLGWTPWPGDALSKGCPERVPLGPAEGPGLVTVCAAASTAEMARLRSIQYPGAVAEDMEGWGVALACVMAGVPLTIVRGLSNGAGQRDHSRWRSAGALESAAALILTEGPLRRRG